jgi:hypothetical protein
LGEQTNELDEMFSNFHDKKKVVLRVINILKAKCFTSWEKILEKWKNQ